MLGGVAIYVGGRIFPVVEDQGHAVFQALGRQFFPGQLLELGPHLQPDIRGLLFAVSDQNDLAIVTVLGLAQKVGGHVGRRCTCVRAHEHFRGAGRHIYGQSL